MREKTNKEDVFDLIQKHPEGLDDDDISAMTGITPRQQVQQLCNRLAASNCIRRESVEKPGKRRKLHNFPIQGNNAEESLSSPEVSDAYETLLDPVRRASYDSSLHAARLKRRRSPVEPIRAEPTRVEPLLESIGMRFPHQAHYSQEPLLTVDLFEDRFEQLFAEMLDDGFADFFRRLF
jgi:hypothetical protein